MIFSFDDLITPLTRQQVEASIYDVLGVVGVNTTTWKPGAVVRTMIVACSIVIAAFSQLAANIARSGFLELAEGAWLTAVAKYVYNVPRREATFAEGELTLTNTGGGVFVLDPDDLVAIGPNGHTYRNTEAVSLGASSEATVTLRATEAGSASNAAPGTITKLETPLIGVTCSNPASLVGLDEEKDPELRARCSEKLGSLSPFGPPDAYAYAARNAKRADGTLVGVTRVRTVKDGRGNVTIYVATAAGGVPGDAEDPDTDLGVVHAAIQQLAAPLAVTAITESAVPVPVTVTYEVWVSNTSGLSEAQYRAAIDQRLLSCFQGQPIGGNVIDPDPGKLFRSALIAAIGAARPETFKVLLSTPALDAVLEIYEVPTIAEASPPGIVHFLAPTEGA